MKSRTILRGLRAVLAACLFGGAAFGAFADAGALHAKYSQLREALAHNPYQRPIHIDSAETGDTLKGNVYAVVDHPFEQFETALKQPEDWCAIMTLPFNAKYCKPMRTANGTVLSMRVARKPEQSVDEAYRIQFAMHPGASDAAYFETRLTAGEGPVGTHDYRITVEAVPLDNGRTTFMHLSYSYASGAMARFAMQTYLNSAGADKVGFSVAGKDAQGRPVYIGGVRGVIERNVMRYYLAIEAQLASLSAPPDQQLDKRIHTWFDSTERYARQLHEMDRAQYIALKRADWQRQQAGLDESSGSRVSSRGGRIGE